MSLPTMTGVGYPGDEVMARFQAKVDRSGGEDACWPWIGAISSNGYGTFRLHRERLIGTHVFALELVLGRRLEPGEEACHHCDNRPCCNPKHLYRGTRQENVDDAVNRDRVKRGSEQPQALLDEQQVLEIRERFACGQLAAALAHEYRISRPTVSRIVNGKGWVHVGGPIRPATKLGRRSDAERNQ